ADTVSKTASVTLNLGAPGISGRLAKQPMVPHPEVVIRNICQGLSSTAMRHAESSDRPEAPSMMAMDMAKAEASGSFSKIRMTQGAAMNRARMTQSTARILRIGAHPSHHSVRICWGLLMTSRPYEKDAPWAARSAISPQDSLKFP